MKKYDYKAVSVDKETHEAIKNISIFTKLPMASVVRALLLKQGFLPEEYNVFTKWDKDNLNKYKTFLEAMKS